MTEEEKLHAIFSPSARPIWKVCTGSIDHREFTETKYTIEGSKAHKVFEWVLVDDQPMLDTYRNHSSDLRDMVDNGIMARDKVFELLEIDKSFIFKEQIEEYAGDTNSDFFGSSDWRFSYLAEDDEGNDLHMRVVMDYKYGKGKIRIAKDDPQGEAYCVLDYRQFKEDERPDIYQVIIAQPRLNSYTIHEIPIEEVYKIERQIEKERAEYYNNPQYRAGSHCGFCSYKGQCPEYLDTNSQLDTEVFNIKDMIESPKKEMSKQERIEILSRIVLKKKDIVSFLNQAEEELYKLLESGEDLPEHKMVAGRSSRDWVDEEKVEKTIKKLGGDPFTKKLMTPPQVQKAIGKKNYEKYFSKLVKTSAGKATMVPKSDKRPGIIFGAKADIEVFAIAKDEE